MGGPKELPQGDFEQGFAGSVPGDMTEVIRQGRASARIAITGRFDQEAKLVQIWKPETTSTEDQWPQVHLHGNATTKFRHGLWIAEPPSFDGFRKIEPEC
jgi:hypothetical protein